MTNFLLNFFGVINFFFIATACIFTLHKEIHQAILNYGPMKMALKLNDLNILGLHKFMEFSQLNISDNHMSLILSSYLINAGVVEFKELVTSDKSLWHLFISMRQTS